MLEGFTIYVTLGGLVITPGLEMAGGKPSRMVYQNWPYAVIKTPGHMRWAGRWREREYEPTTYELLQLGPEKLGKTPRSYQLKPEFWEVPARIYKVKKVLKSKQYGSRWRDWLELRGEADQLAYQRKTKRKEQREEAP